MRTIGSIQIPPFQRILIGCCYFALFARIWPSDRWLILGLISYLPIPPLLGIAVLLAIFVRKSANLLKRIVAYFLVLISVLVLLYENRGLMRINRPAEVKKTIRIMQWNVWSGRRGIQNVASEIASQKPDIVCLNEPKKVGEPFPDYSQYFPGQWYQYSESNILMYSRFESVRQLEFRESMVRGLYVEFANDPRLSALFVDIPAFAGMSRRKSFGIVRRNMRRLEIDPDLILGDFNTPAGSFSMKEILQAGYNDAYLIAGTGWGYTWASLLPQLRIDFILAKKQIGILDYKKSFTPYSDHAWHWADIAR